MQQHKTCTKCGIEKPMNIANFYVHPDCIGGFHAACRPCTNAQRNNWRRKHRLEINEERRQREAERERPKQIERERIRLERFPYRVTAGNLCAGVWVRSKKRGYQVAPELRCKAFVERWLRRQPECPCCRAAFQIGRKGTGKPEPTSPSLDRFDPRGGYTLANVELICWRCNNLKRDATAAELRRIADWMDGRTIFKEAA